MLTIGSHLSIAKGFAQAARDAASIDGNTFQFFTRNPRGGKAKELDEKDLESFRVLCEENGIEGILAHAPYTLNPASVKAETREFAIRTLADDLDRMERIMPGQLYNMHPGSHGGQGVDVGIEQIAFALNEVLKSEQTTTVLLETMAGKGSEVGRSFEEIAAILERLDSPEGVGVCLDTCHIWDGGYDVADALDTVLTSFDDIIGLERLRALHLNDSKNPLGSAKDRHEKLGEGAIGFDAFVAIVNHPRLKALPFYLETPQEKLEGWGEEIRRLREASRN